MKTKTMGQILAADAKRMAWVYLSAIFVAIGLMVYQSVSGVKIFTFNSDLPPAAPALHFQPPRPDAPPQIDPDGIKKINEVVASLETRTVALGDQLKSTQSELATLTRQNDELRSKLVASAADNARLNQLVTIFTSKADGFRLSTDGTVDFSDLVDNSSPVRFLSYGRGHDPKYLTYNNPSYPTYYGYDPNSPSADWLFDFKSPRLVDSKTGHLIFLPGSADSKPKSSDFFDYPLLPDPTKLTTDYFEVGALRARLDRQEKELADLKAQLAAQGTLGPKR